MKIETLNKAIKEAERFIETAKAVPVVAIISVNGKRRRLGSYKKEKDAASAYNKAAKLIYGEYANLNNIY